jgi:hypothetical protein
MAVNDVQSNKVIGQISPYAEKIEIVHRIDDIGTDGAPIRWTGKLVAIIGKNLLFEKRSGRRILVDPTKVIRIIELSTHGRQ